MSTRERRIRTRRKTVNASITIPNALLIQIKEHVELEDITLSQYLRRLARADLEINAKKAA